MSKLQRWFSISSISNGIESMTAIFSKRAILASIPMLTRLVFNDGLVAHLVAYEEELN